MKVIIFSQTTPSIPPQSSQCQRGGVYNYNYLKRRYAPNTPKPQLHSTTNGQLQKERGKWARKDGEYQAMIPEWQKRKEDKQDRDKIKGRIGSIYETSMINIDLFPPCHQQHKQPLLVSSANQLHPSTDHAHHKLATPSKLKPRPLRFSPAHYHDAKCVCERKEERESWEIRERGRDIMSSSTVLRSNSVILDHESIWLIYLQKRWVVIKFKPNQW